jgi:hypothetical protein
LIKPTDFRPLGTSNCVIPRGYDGGVSVGIAVGVEVGGGVAVGVRVGVGGCVSVAVGDSVGDGGMNAVLVGVFVYRDWGGGVLVAGGCICRVGTAAAVRLGVNSGVGVGCRRISTAAVQ